MIHTVETAALLLELPAATLHAGDVAQVLGRLVPGDGSWLYRWDPNSTAGPNGGTVLVPAGMPAAGRWLLCHSGTVDARCFGVFGPDVPADDALDAGRVMTWRRVEPIERVCVQDMEFRGNEGGEETGAQPLAFEYAVRCDVRDVRARHTYWPVLLRRHNTEYVTERCSLANPIEVVVGGTGYLTQQIHCLYGKVRDCTTSNARHLNDFTGSAYCMVENCHGDGDFHGAYVTHGQFEHDLTYVGNSGLLSFANSGPTWGSSAKRITVVRHTGFWGIGFAKVSDLTLQDVAVCRTGAYDGVNTEGYGPCGTFLLNADGLQMRGCTAEKLVLTQRSRRAKRPAIVEGCWFRDGIEVVRTGEGAVAPGTPLILRDNLTGPGGPQQAEGTE